MFRDGAALKIGRWGNSDHRCEKYLSHVVIADEYVADDYKALIRRLTLHQCVSPRLNVGASTSVYNSRVSHCHNFVRYLWIEFYPSTGSFAFLRGLAIIVHQFPQPILGKLLSHSRQRTKSNIERKIKGRTTEIFFFQDFTLKIKYNTLENAFSWVTRGILVTPLRRAADSASGKSAGTKRVWFSRTRISRIGCSCESWVRGLYNLEHLERVKSNCTAKESSFLL